MTHTSAVYTCYDSYICSLHLLWLIHLQFTPDMTHL